MTGTVRGGGLMALSAGWMVLVTALHAAAEVRVVAEPGQPAIGLEGTHTMGAVDNQVIAASGHVAFDGFVRAIAGSGEASGNALWAGKPDSLRLVVRENDPVAGLPANVLYRQTTQPRTVVTRTGKLAFVALLKGAVTGFTDGALLADVDGTLRAVAREGDPAPGYPPGTTLRNISELALTDAGLVFAAATSTTGTGLWYWDFDMVSEIGTRGTPAAPAFPECGLNRIGDAANFGINASGSVLVHARLVRLSAAECPDDAILIWRAASGFAKVVAVGDSVPGMADTRFSEILGRPHLDRAGNVIFKAYLRDSVSFFPRESVWVARAGGALEVLALQSESIGGNPGNLLGGQTFFASRANIAGGANTAMSVRATNGFALLTGRPRSSQPYAAFDDAGPSQLRVVAAVGGFPPGFESTWAFESLGAPHLNAREMVSFGGTVIDALAPNTSRRRGIWRYRDATVLEPIVYEGMSLELGAAESTITLVRALESVSFSGSDGGSTEGGLATQMDDDGRVLFRARRTGVSGGDGLYITAPITPPDPGDGPVGPGDSEISSLVPVLLFALEEDERR